MKVKWFKKLAGVYLPVHPAGYCITALALLFLVPVIISTNAHTHSVSDFLYTLFVYTTCTAFWWKWIAEKTS